MTKMRWMMVAIGVVLLAGAFYQIQNAARGLEIVEVSSGDLPVTIIRPDEDEAVSRATVLIGHGFAGSGLLMRGFAYTFAHAGYNVVLWDFDGHASNPVQFPGFAGRDVLVANAEAALKEAENWGLVMDEGVAIVGHSMGSGVALAYGQKHADMVATIAISPVMQSITPDLPRNLLLLAGSLESSFVKNAQNLLEQAGGSGGDPQSGTAREMITIAGVEHISILFSQKTHAATLDWLQAVFGRQPGAKPYTERRILWWGVGLLGAMILFMSISPSVENHPEQSKPSRPLWQPLGAVAAAVVVSTLLMWSVSLVGIDIYNLLGLIVGGYLFFWFCLVGMFALWLLRLKPSAPTLRELFAGVAAFGALWIGVGVFGQLTWLHWMLIPKRLFIWIVGSSLLMPWFYIYAYITQQASAVRKLAWWIFSSAVVAGGLMLSVQLNGELGFLLIILPLVPVMFVLQTITTWCYRRVWSIALAGALFMSWIFAAVLPIQ